MYVYRVAMRYPRARLAAFPTFVAKDRYCSLVETSVFIVGPDRHAVALELLFEARARRRVRSFTCPNDRRTRAASRRAMPPIARARSRSLEGRRQPIAYPSPGVTETALRPDRTSPGTHTWLYATRRTRIHAHAHARTPARGTPYRIACYPRVQISVTPGRILV
jgi:hypothetical protein